MNMEKTLFTMMNGGSGPTSYSKNSMFQKTQMELAKPLLINSILENLVPLPSPGGASHRVFRIADLGCSVGPNTFECVQTIVEAVVSSYKSKGLDCKTLEFQVFFNDQVINDFNTLFLNLPSDRPYKVAGVPGSFHSRLFPMASIDFFHSGYALHWLTKVPSGVKNPKSLVWNKGRITYAESNPEVGEAFKTQFGRDMRSFFEARSVEMVDGGLLALLMPCRKAGTPISNSNIVKGFECLGHVLMDMVAEGLVEEELVDSFNLPIFIPTASEVAEAISGFEGLRVEVTKEIHSVYRINTTQAISSCSSHYKAILQNILSQQFGSAITDVAFEKLPDKLEKFSRTPFFANSQQVENLFMLIKKISGVSVQV